MQTIKIQNFIVFFYVCPHPYKLIHKSLLLRQTSHKYKWKWGEKPLPKAFCLIFMCNSSAHEALFSQSFLITTMIVGLRINLSVTEGHGGII